MTVVLVTLTLSTLTCSMDMWSYCGWSCVSNHNLSCDKLSRWLCLSEMGHALKYIPRKIMTNITKQEKSTVKHVVQCSL